MVADYHCLLLDTDELAWSSDLSHGFTGYSVLPPCTYEVQHVQSRTILDHSGEPRFPLWLLFALIPVLLSYFPFPVLLHFFPFPPFLLFSCPSVYAATTPSLRKTTEPNAEGIGGLYLQDSEPTDYNPAVE